MKIAESNSHITILTLNVNGLNASNKRHRQANRIKSKNPLVCYIQETYLTYKDTHRLKIKGWKEDLPNKWRAKKKKKNKSCNSSL